jgi:C-terminal processing protease CtpA/Prc
MVAEHVTYMKYVENPGKLQHLRKVNTGEGTFQVDYSYPGTKLREPVTDYRYKGNLIVLANGGTVSAASEFVALVKHHKRATIIGEETAGCYYGSTGGNYLHLTLPASKLKVRIPTIRIFNAVAVDTLLQPFGRGVLPDVEVEPDIKSRINNSDTVLKFAAHYLRSKMGKKVLNK